jgi:hypothetical protein
MGCHLQSGDHDQRRPTASVYQEKIPEIIGLIMLRYRLKSTRIRNKRGVHRNPRRTSLAISGALRDKVTSDMKDFKNMREVTTLARPVQDKVVGSILVYHLALALEDGEFQPIQDTLDDVSKSFINFRSNFKDADGVNNFIGAINQSLETFDNPVPPFAVGEEGIRTDVGLDDTPVLNVSADAIYRGTQDLRDIQEAPASEPTPIRRPTPSKKKTRRPSARRVSASRASAPASEPEILEGEEEAEFFVDEDFTEGARTSDQRTKTRPGKIPVQGRYRNKADEYYEIQDFPDDMFRMAKFKERHEHVQKTLAPYMLFLQQRRRTLPLPSVKDWVASIEKGQEGIAAVIPKDFPLDVKSDRFRSTVFVMYRNAPMLPTQMFVPSLNPISYRQRRGKKVARAKSSPVWVPAMEFISRPDLNPAGYQPTELRKLGVEKDTPIGGVVEGEYGNTSWAQMLFNYAGVLNPNSTWRRKSLGGKYSGYDVIFFTEDEEGKPVAERYFPAPSSVYYDYSAPTDAISGLMGDLEDEDMPSRTLGGEDDDFEVDFSANPRRRRRVFLLAPPRGSEVLIRNKRKKRRIRRKRRK